MYPEKVPEVWLRYTPQNFVTHTKLPLNLEERRDQITLSIDNLLKASQNLINKSYTLIDVDYELATEMYAAGNLLLEQAFVTIVESWLSKQMDGNKNAHI